MNSAPWRKVVDLWYVTQAHYKRTYLVEKLECGHEITHHGEKPPAKKRRCMDCDYATRSAKIAPYTPKSMEVTFNE